MFEQTLGLCAGMGLYAGGLIRGILRYCMGHMDGYIHQKQEQIHPRPRSIVGCAAACIQLFCMFFLTPTPPEIRSTLSYVPQWMPPSVMVLQAICMMSICLRSLFLTTDSIAMKRRWPAGAFGGLVRFTSSLLVTGLSFPRLLRQCAVNVQSCAGPPNMHLGARKARNMLLGNSKSASKFKVSCCCKILRLKSARRWAYSFLLDFFTCFVSYLCQYRDGEVERMILFL